MNNSNLVEPISLTSTSVVPCIPFGDRTLDRAHRELDNSIPLELSLIDRCGYSPIRRVVLKSQHASANRYRPRAREHRSATAEPVGARHRVDQQHRPGIGIVL